MQTDMHYYGTYAMARAAGLTSGAAQVIATAAEYVDDSGKVEVILEDGVFFEAAATAHHPVDLENLVAIDQRRIWIPFHFIPGNEGNFFEERLICRKDSALAQEMVAHHLAAEDRGYKLELMGIAAHVYADTFSHYGFSGISSELNKVDPDSIELHIESHLTRKYLLGKAEVFFENLASKVATAVGLGHGSVATYPDRPFLRWSFRYENEKFSVERKNQETFLEACQKLHGMFTEFSRNNSDCYDPLSYRNFHDIKEAVAQVLAVEGKMDERIEAWQSAATTGRIYSNPSGEIMPIYNKAFDQDINILQSSTYETVASTTGYAFLAAAKFHRDYVLDELLPKYGLHVLIRS